MGNCVETKHLDKGAVKSGAAMGGGSDLDAAVLATQNFGGGGLSNKLQISFAAENLPNMDTMSLSDPFVVFYKRQGNVWQQLGRTEIIHDNLNPRWVKKIMVDFHFEQQEQFKIEVYDSDDDKTKNLNGQDFIGSLEF